MRRIIKDQRSARTADGDERRPAGNTKLDLRRQTLRELTSPELSAAGGRLPSSISTFTPDI